MLRFDRQAHLLRLVGERPEAGRIMKNEVGKGGLCPTRSTTGRGSERGSLPATLRFGVRYLVAIADVLAREIRSLLVEVYETSAPAGSAPSTLAKAERRIGRALPATLRTYYELVGRHPASRALHHLVAPAKLELTERGLIFLHEQQDVCFYAIQAADFALDDPPLFQGNHDEDTWYPDCGRLSSFLIKNLCWQAMEVLESEQLSVSDAAWRAATSGMRPIEVGPPEPYDMEAVRHGGLVACAFPVSRGKRPVYVAARDARKIDRFTRRLAGSRA